jgi:hypothetical protein
MATKPRYALETEENCMQLSLNRILVATLMGAMLAPMAPAAAGDIQGDAYSCEELWVMRNQFYKDRGYCFKTSKAIAYFGNAGCIYDEDADVPLTKSERHIIRDIRKSEARQAC